MAGGLEIALACDLLVAAEGAKLGVPEVKRSLVAAGGALLRLPRKVPDGVAMELALTGDPITAERGFELGLVNRVAQPGKARRRRARAGRRDREERTARRRRDEADPRASSGTGPTRTSGTKQGEISGPVFTSQDAQEGSIAFAEKRDPVWKGASGSAGLAARASRSSERAPPRSRCSQR